MNRKGKRGILSLEMITNIIFIGLFTLTIVGSVYFFANMSYKNNFQIEGNVAFPKLKCIFNDDSNLFKDKSGIKNGEFIIDYDVYRNILKGNGADYEAFVSNCNFADEKDSTFAYKLSLDSDDEYNIELKEVLDKDFYINKDAYDYYKNIVAVKRNILKNLYSSKGKGSSVLITREYNVLIEKDDKLIPVILMVDLVMPVS